MDQHPVRCEGRIQRGKGPCKPGLAAHFKRAIKAVRPVDVLVSSLGQPFDGHARKRQVVRRLGIKDAIDKDDLQPVQSVERLAFVARIKALRAGGRRLRSASPDRL